MSNNQLLLELLQLSSGLNSFQQLQLLNIQQSNSLFSFAPELLNFVQGCGNSLNILSQFASSPVNSLLFNLNNGQSACLSELVQLEQLFLSGNSNIDLSNNSNLNNGQDLSNSSDVSASNSSASASVDVSNSTAAANVSAPAAQESKKGKKEGKRAEIVQRSGASKRQVLGSLGFAALLISGVFAL